jgi:hypothetical protein
LPAGSPVSFLRAVPVICIDGVRETLAFFGIGTPDHFFDGIDELIPIGASFFFVVEESPPVAATAT